MALKHWTRIIQRWPVDKVRPENVSFQKVMQRRLDKLASSTTPNEAANSITSNEALVVAVPPQTWSEEREMKQVNALDSLLEDRYSKSFPLPQSLRKPASNPTYYDDLMKEMQEAPSRSWLGGIVKRIKGSFRLT